LKNRFKKLRFFDFIFLFGFITCILLVSYAAFVEPFTLNVTAWNVQTKKWAYPKNLKIALLSDMHMIWPWMTTEHMQDIVDKTNSLKPDIILLLGDYVATHPFGLAIEPNKGVAPFKNFLAPCGIFAVLGNHDTRENFGWPEALIETEIPVLQNQSKKIVCQGQALWIAGLDELWWRHADIQKTFETIKDESPVIMMLHNPDSFAEMPDRVTLTVAGHTHGGQIRFPFIGAISQVIPSKYGKRYAYGHIIEDDKDLVVTSGLGMTGIPLRFLTPPEIAIVTISSN
jgi:predicted MPP superfamily phosphohydrolase